MGGRYGAKRWRHRGSGGSVPTGKVSELESRILSNRRGMLAAWRLGAVEGGRREPNTRREARTTLTSGLDQSARRAAVLVR